VGPSSRTTPKRLARERRGEDEVPELDPLTLELVAAVLSSGAAPASALAHVGRCLLDGRDGAGSVLLACADLLTGTAQVPDPTAVTGTGAVAELLEALRLAESTGLGPSALVLSVAAQRRHAASSRRARAARRLSVLVVLPTGLCLLPAFVLLGIVPLVLSLLTRQL
jgi:tight adherence protein B